MGEYGRMLAGELDRQDDRRDDRHTAAFRRAMVPVGEQRRVTSRPRLRSEAKADDDLEAEDVTEAEREIAEPLPVVKATVQAA